MMRSRSLSRRLLLAVIAVELLCFAAFAGTSLWYEQRSRFRAFDVMLQGRSDSLLGAVQDAEDPEDRVIIDPTELKLPQQDIYAVYNQGGRLLGGASAATPLLLSRGGDGVRTLRIGSRQYRILEREGLRVIDRGENAGVGLRRPVTIVYGAPTGPVWHQIFEAARFYILLSLLLLGASTLVLLILLRQLMRPIPELALAAGRITSKSLVFEAPPQTLAIAELQPLAEALRSAVHRLHLAFSAEHRFVGDAAHELKTALAVVRSSVQLLMLRERSPAEYRTGLERVLADNERAEALVGQMLSLARSEERSPRLDAPVEISGTVANVVSTLQSFAAARSVRLQSTVQLGVRLPMQPEAVETVVSNLAVNAIQHSHREGVVEIFLRTGTQQGVELEVTDHGEGIGPEALPHIFDRFYREDVSRSRETGGVGLGLAICKSIVEGAGGTIRVRSTRGEGTAVHVRFG